MKKISINKLAEYLNAGAIRRRSLIREQKDPLVFIVTRYKEARNAMINFLTSGFEENIIDECLEKLINKQCVTDFEKSDQKTSIEALEAFLKIRFPELLLNFEITKATKKYNISINGLKININPDAIIRGKYRGKNIVGGIKIHISKSYPLTDENQKNVATMVHKIIREQELDDTKNEVSNLNFCISIDAFNSEYNIAPKSYKSRLKNIEVACNEIGLVWDDI